jgi:hypothetical protein
MTDAFTYKLRTTDHCVDNIDEEEGHEELFEFKETNGFCCRYCFE